MSQVERVKSRLKLRQLEVVLAVAQSGSMAKAAQRLAITQPVISKSVADLEHTLGVRLFDRTSQGVEPTRYGQALLQRSIAMFNDLRTTVNELAHLSDPTVGDLRLGSSETIAAGLLGIIIDRLSRQHARLTFEVTLGGDLADLPHRDLREHNIDLIIGRLPKTIPDDMEATTLYEDEMFVVAGIQNNLVRRRKVKLEDVLNEPWCGASFDSFPWVLFREALRAKGLEVPSNVVRTRSILARNGLLATGRFVTILPRSMLYFAAKNFALKRVPVHLSVPKFPVGIVTLKNRTITPVAQLFIERAREVVKPFLNDSQSSRRAKAWRTTTSS